MKDTFYFSHDYNTRSDEKIVKLLRKHGMTGYGIFWGIVEMLYNNENSLKMDCDDIAYELRADAKMIESVINDFDLFTVNDGYFGSESIEKRLTERDKISERARQKAFKRWRKDTTASETDATASETDATAPKMDAGKERKGKNINERKEYKEMAEKFLDEINEIFADEYKKANKHEYIPKDSTKEREAGNTLLQIITRDDPDVDYYGQIETARKLFEQAVRIDDTFWRGHMTLPSLVKNYSQIRNILKNGTAKKKRGQTPDEILKEMDEYEKRTNN